MGQPVTIDRLYELVIYDPAAGQFHWVSSRPKCREGAVAGWINAQGYRCIKIDGITYAAHRLAWLYMLGHWPKGQIDHVNRDRADNAWLNLREATQSQNNGNTIARVGLKGVHRHHDGRWRAQIMIDGKRIHLGCFSVQQDAHRAYTTAAEKYFGEFARVA